MNKSSQFICILFSALVLLSSSAFCAPWEGQRLSEDQLRHLETKPSERNRKELLAKLYSKMSQLEIMFSYIEAAKVKMEQVVLKPESGKAEPPSSAIFNLAVIDGLKNGTHTPRNDKLFQLSIAMDVISWATADATDEEIQNIDLKNYDKHPFLFLVKIDKSDEKPNSIDIKFEESDKKLKDLFQANQEFVLSLPLHCDIAYYRTSALFGARLPVGTPSMQYSHGYRPAVEHDRLYLCATDELDMSFGQAAKNMVTLTTQRSYENFWISRILFPYLDRSNTIQSLLKITPDNKDMVALELYKTVAPHLNKEWYAVYSMPNAAGEWKVFVANDNTTIEFPLPSKPKK